MENIIGISSVLLGLAVLGSKRSLIIKQLILFCIFIVGVTIVGEIDILLPIYTILSLFPFIRSSRYLHKDSFVVIAYFLLYFAYGILFQDTISSLMYIFSKYLQLIIFFFVISYKIDSNDEWVSNKYINFMISLEIILAVYLVYNSEARNPNGLVRLVSNAQPITGNISIVILPIIILKYYKDQEERTKIIRKLLIMLVLVIASGTRGYLMQFAFGALILFYDHYIRGLSYSGNRRKTRVVLSVLLLTAVVFIAIFIPTFNKTIDSLLGITASTGIRRYETAVELQFFKESSIAVKLFGIGIGGKPGSYSSYVSSVYEQISKGMWRASHYLNESGGLYHNLYLNVLLNFGVLGIMVCIYVFYYIWKYIGNKCENNRICLALRLYFIGFIISNYFRWSTDCGICELIVLALTIKYANSISITSDDEITTT